MKNPEAKPMPATPPPAPVFNEQKAVHVTPYRFEKTVEGKPHAGNGRTVGFHQPSATAGHTDLFGFTQQHIATLPEAEAAALFVEPNPKHDAQAAHRHAVKEHHKAVAAAAKAASAPAATPTEAPAEAPANAG